MENKSLAKSEVQAAFLGQQSFSDCDFIVKVLDCMCFNTFVSERGPPYGICDILDEIYANVHDTLKAESKSSSLVLQHIQELAQHLYLNTFPAVLKALQNKTARLALTQELSFLGTGNKAMLEHQQFNLVVQLMNCSLQKLCTGVIRFTYSCIRDHPVFQKHQSWEAAFYQDVQRDALYVPSESPLSPISPRKSKELSNTWSRSSDRISNSYTNTEKASDQVSISDYSPEAEDCFLQFQFCGDLRPENLACLLVVYNAADKCGIPGLQQRCSEIMRSTLTPQGACVVLTYAVLSKDNAAEISVRNFIISNLLDVLWEPFWGSFLSQFRDMIQELKEIRRNVI